MLVGLGVGGMGLWARREVRRGLERERIVAPGGAEVTTASAARALAETIRHETLDATGGKTYAEIGPYLASDGSGTSDAAAAVVDKTTGKPVTNPDVELWIQSTALQTALMQAYMVFRIADLMVALGSGFVLAGAGIAAASGRR